MGTKLTLQPGDLAVYEGEAVTIKELLSSSHVMIDWGGTIIKVGSGEILPFPKKRDVLAKPPSDGIKQEVWDDCAARDKVLQAALKDMDTPKSDIAKSVAEALKVSERHAYRLLNIAKESKTVSSLVPATSGRKPGSRMLLPEKEKIITELITQFYAVRERPTLKELHERIVPAFQAAGLTPPAYSTVARRVKAQMDRKATKKREGEKKTKAEFDAYPGHVETTAALERVEIDHTPMDVMAISDDPDCPYVGRPWLTIAIDVYTRCILGFYITFEPPSTLSVAMCMASVFEPKDPLKDYGVPLEWPMEGIPQEIVCDNAREFDSASLQHACDELRVILYFRPKGAANYGGTIERLIGTMMGKCHLLPGTTKNSVRTKGDYDSKEHAVMTLSHLRTWFVEQILGNYHVKEHRSLRMPPAEVWRIATEEVLDDADAEL